MSRHGMKYPKTDLPRYFATVPRPRPRAHLSLHHFIAFLAVVIMLIVDRHRQTSFLVPLYPFVISMHLALRVERHLLHTGAMAVVAGITALTLCGLSFIEATYQRYKFQKRAPPVERNHFMCFTVCTSRECSQQWGLSIGARTKLGFAVTKVIPASAFWQYNATMRAQGNHAYSILPGDVIVGANGQPLRDVDRVAMTKIFKKATETIRIAILRANDDFVIPTRAHWKADENWEYAVTLRKKTPLTPLGIRLTGNAADGMSMRIDVIRDGGFIQKLNARGLGVEAGDEIVAANGVRNDLPKLVRTLEENKILDLTIRACRAKCDKVEMSCPKDFVLRCLTESGKLEVSGVGSDSDVLNDGDIISSVNGSTCPSQMSFLLATEQHVIAYIVRKELPGPPSNGASDTGQLIKLLEQHCADMERNLARVHAQAKSDEERMHKVERLIRAHRRSSGRCGELVDVVEKLVSAVAKATPSFTDCKSPVTAAATAHGASRENANNKRMPSLDTRKTWRHFALASAFACVLVSCRPGRAYTPIFCKAEPYFTFCQRTEHCRSRTLPTVAEAQPNAWRCHAGDTHGCRAELKVLDGSRQFRQN